MVKTKDISVVVQGAINKELTPKCLKSIRKFLPDAEIILSTWEGSEVEGLDYDILVLNKDPGAYYCNRKKTIKNNLNRQIISTKNGLEYANRKYIMKMRSDIILTNNSFLDYVNKFPKRIEKYAIFNERILISSLFSREAIYNIYNNKIDKFKLSISDWWHFGLNEDIKLLFDVNTVEEPYFSEYYLKHPKKSKEKEDYTWKYAPEDHFAQHLKKDLCKKNFVTNSFSKRILVNNFVFLGYKESGMCNEKYLPYSKDERLLLFEQYPGLITYYKFLQLYKKYVDKNFKIPKDVIEYYSENSIYQTPLEKISLEIMKVIRGNKIEIPEAYMIAKRENNLNDFIKMIESKDISVVVQGAINKELTPKCLKSIRKFLPDAEIILSTWEGSNVEALDYDILVLNKDPGGVKHDYAIQNKFASMNNCNRQLISTQNGIQKATKKYILKLRTDLILRNNNFLNYWDKFSIRNTDYSIFNHRVLVSTLYSREHSCQYGNGYPVVFHPSDFWFFGTREDIIDYFMDCPQQKKEEGANWIFKYPNRCPYNTASHRYAPEQQFCYNWVKKHFPEVQFEDWSDWNEENIEMSNTVLYNNFIFLGLKQSGIYSKKYALSLNNEDLIQGLISYKHFREQYKNYCDENFVVEEEIQEVSENRTWQDDLHLPKYLKKLQKHWKRFITPFNIIFNSIFGFVGVVFYILHIMLNLVIFMPRFIYKSFKNRRVK